MVNKEDVFEVGDKVISLEDGKEGIVARLCGDPTAVFVRWDDSSTQQRMVEVASLKALGGKVIWV